MMLRGLVNTATLSVVCALGATLVVSACDNRDEVLLRDFCEPILEYFRTDFKIDGIKFSEGGSLDDPVQDDDYHSYSCPFKFDKSRKSLGADARIEPEGSGYTVEYMRSRGFRVLSGHAAEVWFEDDRNPEPDYYDRVHGSMSLYTKVGPWKGSLYIDNDHEPLVISDKQISIAADVLIEALRKMYP